jgi:hypothetical protein
MGNKQTKQLAAGTFADGTLYFIKLNPHTIAAKISCSLLCGPTLLVYSN